MLTTNAHSFNEIGTRLRAHRIGCGYTSDQLAARLGISRAALYRVEKGEIAKIGLLDAIAAELGVSLPTLLGVGIEYVPSALAFFERMRQVENGCERIVGLFSPVSYLLTSDRYDVVLADVLNEGHAPEDMSGEATAAQSATVAALLEVLALRKAAYLRDRPQIVSIVSSLDLERLLRHGLEGRRDLPAPIAGRRRAMARAEVVHIADLLRTQAMGVQIGIAREPIPATSFQIVRREGRSTLTVSPFRLGQQPNIRIGVGMVTSAPDAIALHEDIMDRLWDSALKSVEAADYLDRLIAGVDSDAENTRIDRDAQSSRVRADPQPDADGEKSSQNCDYY